MATLRECSSCNIIHGEPRDRRCTGAITGSLLTNDTATGMEEQADSQLNLAQASTLNLSQETLISQETVLNTIGVLGGFS